MLNFQYAKTAQFSMDFHIVILDDFVKTYPQISWKKWKDYVREQMISQATIGQ